MLIGREDERQILTEALQAEYSQFIAVYGRRRVGKTFLIRESFQYKFAFHFTGAARWCIFFLHSHLKCVTLQQYSLIKCVRTW